MGRASSIKRLPPEIRDAIASLREAGHTLDEILAHIRTLGAEVSRSSLHRHVQNFEKAGERLRRSRELSNALIDKLGAAPESKTARLNIEMLQSSILDLFTGEDGAPVTLDPQQAMYLARALRDITNAAKADAELALKLRAEVAKEAATIVDEAAREGGLSAERADELRRKVLGLAERKQ